jgi:two-component system LytT family response regulator
MALRIVIIEDEPATARNLQFLLHEIDPGIEVLATLGSVKDSVAWMKTSAHQCELIFMDIRLNDGLSLDIFGQVEIAAPVIFVTAYNDYALQAFKANGIDYILKPVDPDELAAALQRFKRLTGRDGNNAPKGYASGGNTPNGYAPGGSMPDNATLLALAVSLRSQRSYKQSFLVHFRDKLLPLGTEAIAWFHSANEVTSATTLDNQKHVVDFTLEQLQEQLDPQAFFRVNRQFIVHRKAIREVDFYFNGRLLVKTQPAATEQMLISKARVPEFKAWMNS